MKTLITLILISTSFNAIAEDNFFVNVRNGYQLNVTDKFIINDKRYDASYGHHWRINVSAGFYIPVGFCKDLNCKIGVSHESSPLSGKGLSDQYDYFNEQIFFEVEKRF